MKAKHTDQELLDALNAHGSKSAAAAALGVDRRGFARRVDKLLAEQPGDEKRDGPQGQLPEHPSAPTGFDARAVSTLYDADGKVKAQWVKASKADDLERFLRAIRETCEPLPRAPVVVRAEVASAANLLTAYPMGDPHLGMYSWAAETGADFDVEIAERNITEAVRRLVAGAPPSKFAFLVNVGDFFHADNLENRTMRSGHVLDVDTRWTKVLRIGVRCFRTMIDCALEKHEVVYVVCAMGNHDDHSSQMLALALQMLYESNPRVVFLDNPGKFHYLRFGQCLFGVTHGDTVKPDKLPLVMAADRAADWGATKFRYWFTGHIHTRKVFEDGEVLVESFRTLAARDAWTHGSGYRSGRDMYAITYHEDLGEIERHRVDIAALEAVPS